jgi:hypothetical protein
MHIHTQTNNPIRYDAKADLWSVGTVLFEMIAGRPPFNGENHIDLLRNIQRKAVRLPPDVRVSKACVNLLRILLNRNPLSRAGFKEFFAACDTFVALGCNGTPTCGDDPDNEGGGTVGGFNNNNTNNNRIATKDLGTIHENDHQLHHGSGGGSGGGGTTTTSANNNMNPSSDSLMTVATTMEQNQQQQQQHTKTSMNPAICANQQQQQQQQQGNSYNQQHQLQPTTTSNIVSPNLTPSTAPIAAALIPNSINLYSHHHPSASRQQQQPYQQQPSTMMIRNRLSPLTSSPPSLGPMFHPPPPSHHHDRRGVLPPQFPSSSHNMGTANTNNNAGGTTQHPNLQQTWQQQQQQQQQQQPSSLGYYNSGGSTTPTGMIHANSVVSQSQASVNDDSGFVMVEHTGGASPHSSEHYYNVTASSQQQQQHHLQAIEQQQRRVSKGMLGTSPGTGKMLLGMVGRAATIGFGVGGSNNNNNNNNNNNYNNTAIASSISTANQQHQFGQQRSIKLADAIAATNKMIATAEDVGRRAVSVAHLGDGRAYLGMRLIFKTNEEGSSLLSTTPMEGVEEEDEAEESGGGTTDGGSCSSTSADIRDFSTHNSSSTEIMAPSTRRRRSSSTVSDSNINNNKQMMVTEESVEDEMPFAISPDAPSVSLPSRSNPSVYNRGSSMSRSMKKSSSMKANPQTIRSRFKEALSCYLKSLKMLKGAVGAAQRVTKDLTEIETQNMLLGQNNQTTTEYDIPKMKYRCEVTSNWLCSQFRGVLERADAANVEISKLDKQQEPGQEQEETASIVTTSVEELIYNHALASGRDGAVKHLLGQYEAARSCYRSAGLLAETLLMEVNIGPEDRKILEGYVDGFAARITELDQLMFQQSRMTLSSNTTPSSRRGSGIVGLIGTPQVAPTAFITGSPR